MNKTIYYSIILVIATYWFYYAVKDEYHRLYFGGEKEKIVYYHDFHNAIWSFTGLFIFSVVLPFGWLIYHSIDDSSFTGFQKPKKIGISPFMAESLYRLDNAFNILRKN